jgi:hypothetical protein
MRARVGRSRLVSSAVGDSTTYSSAPDIALITSVSEPSGLGEVGAPSESNIFLGASPSDNAKLHIGLLCNDAKLASLTYKLASRKHLDGFSETHNTREDHGSNSRAQS